MDGNTGYHQIRIVEEDIPKTIFLLPINIVIFEWVTMDLV